VLAGADEFRITDAGHQPDLRTVRDQSVDPYDPQCSACFGPLDTDARHRVTLSGLYRGPWDLNLSGIFRYHSATPYTAWDGVTDKASDSYLFDLAPGVAHVNTLRGDSFSQLDVRLAKAFKFGGNYGVELIGEIFNLFNAKNPVGFVGREFVLNSAGEKVPNPNFGQPSAFAGDPGLGEQRLAQLGLRLTF